MCRAASPKASAKRQEAPTFIQENWHWIRDTQIREDHHRYRGNGAGVMATLRTAAMNVLQLAGFASI